MGSPKKTISYRFDSVGNRVGMTDPDGARFTYAYDAVNRISRLVNPQGDRTTYAYDPGGRRTVKKLADGTRASFSYDAASNLTRLANLKSDGTTISSFDYSYDRVGNRTAVLEADGSRVTWSYDNTYQLTGEHRTGSNAYQDTYTYDASGNRLLKTHDGARTTYSYDAANQLEWSEDASGRTTYTFDADGNQQLVVEPTGDRTTTSWDYENRTTLVQLPSGIRNTMAYEPGGLRVKLEESTGTKKFVWDDQNYLAETDENDDTQVVYTNEPRQYGNLVSQRRGTDSHWYHFDAIGSTRELTDASETVTDTRLYDAWGVTMSSSGTPFREFGFAGELEYWTALNLNSLYVRARRYLPPLGRWLSADTVTHNEFDYAYSRNSPLTLCDPSGHITVHYEAGRGSFTLAVLEDDCGGINYGSALSLVWYPYEWPFRDCNNNCLCEVVDFVQIIRGEAHDVLGLVGLATWHVDGRPWYPLSTRGKTCPERFPAGMRDDPGYEVRAMRSVEQTAEVCIACVSGGAEEYVPRVRIYVYGCVSWEHSFKRTGFFGGMLRVKRSIRGFAEDEKTGSTCADAAPVRLTPPPDPGHEPSSRFQRTLTRGGY